MIALAFSASLISSSTPTFAAASAGARCPKPGNVEIIGSKKYTCIFNGKKFLWNKGVLITQTSGDSRATAKQYPISAINSFRPLEACNIKSTIPTAGSLGFPRDSSVLPSVGSVRGVTLLVDFNDLKDDGNSLRVWKTQHIPTAEKFYKLASYGKMDLKIDLIETVFHINDSVLKYNLDTPHDLPPKPNANPDALISDAVAAADSQVDFSKYDFVNVVTPKTNLIGYEGARGLRMMADGKLLKNGTFGSIREYVDSPTKYNWLVHESGHLLGLIHPFNNSGKFYSGYVIPGWDLMGDAATPTPEFLAWSKNLMGWLDSAQVNCLSAEDKSITTHLITPLSGNAVGTKAVFVKISDTQVLVIENRRASQLDAVKRDQEGVLVYVVDGSIENNLGAVTFLFSKLTTTSDYRLIGTLQPGAGVKYKKVNIKVLSSAVSGDFVSLDIG